jgi:tRNA (guanine-N7-)-methyltransferase
MALFVVRWWSDNSGRRISEAEKEEGTAMRRTRRLPLEQLAAYEWRMPWRVPRGCLLDERGLARVAGVNSAGKESSSTTPEIVPPTPIDWQALFGNDRPVEIEVGMGKGQFLLMSALQRPEVNFFGIEVVRKYQLYATTRCAIRQLANVRTTCADARWVLHFFVPAESVQAVHVYFPDPWWKARHKKRRLFNTEFVYDVARILQPAGQLLLATDVEEYFGVMCDTVREVGAFQELQAGPDNSTPPEWQTNFEKKARARGNPIWRAVFARRQTSSGDHT